MDDIFSKMISIILITIMLCIIPAFYISLFTDLNNNNYILNQMELLLDKITLKGYIEDDEFLYDDNLEVIVERDLYVPEKEEITNYAFKKNVILQNIEEKNIQKFEYGDVVTLMYNGDYSNSNIFFKRLFGMKEKNNDITFAGVVKNECY